jgi:hypothetical protein
MLPEHSPVLAIMDTGGSCWPSDSDGYAKLGLSDALLSDLRARVDDGAEPILTQAGDMSIMFAQLATTRTNCGYVLIAANTGDSASAALADMMEVLLGQIALVARLIEQNAMLNQSHAHQYAIYATGEAPAN